MLRHVKSHPSKTTVKNKMSEHVLEFNLEKQAKNKGGDKYICSNDPGFSIYVPQAISRKTENTCLKKLKVTITSEED